MTYCGFQTSQGSLYFIDPCSGETTRFKVSDGTDKGETLPGRMCLYVPPSANQMLNEQYNLSDKDKENTIWLCERNSKGYFAHIRESASLQSGKNLHVVLLQRSSSKILGAWPASAAPVKGYLPIEKKYNTDGTRFTHVGNPIVTLYSDSAAFAKAAASANAPPEFLSLIQPQRTGNLRKRITAALARRIPHI